MISSASESCRKREYTNQLILCALGYGSIATMMKSAYNAKCMAWKQPVTSHTCTRTHQHPLVVSTIPRIWPMSRSANSWVDANDGRSWRMTMDDRWRWWLWGARSSVNKDKIHRDSSTVLRASSGSETESAATHKSIVCVVQCCVWPWKQW